MKNSNTAPCRGLCPQIPGFPMAPGPDSPPPHSKSRAIPTSLRTVILSLGALKHWGRHIFKCQVPLGLTAHVLMLLPGASPWGSGKPGSHCSHMQEAHALAPRSCPDVWPLPACLCPRPTLSSHPSSWPQWFRNISQPPLFNFPFLRKSRALTVYNSVNIDWDHS